MFWGDKYSPGVLGDFFISFLWDWELEASVFTWLWGPVLDFPSFLSASLFTGGKEFLPLHPHPNVSRTSGPSWCHWTAWPRLPICTLSFLVRRGFGKMCAQCVRVQNLPGRPGFSGWHLHRKHLVFCLKWVFRKTKQVYWRCSSAQCVEHPDAVHGLLPKRSQMRWVK